MNKHFVIGMLICCAGVASLEAEVRIGTSEALKAAVSKIQPQYPPVARQMKVAGHVELEVIVNTDGTVASAKAVSGNPMLTQPAIAAVEKWKFSPFTVNGEAIKAITNLGFDFRP